MINFWVLFSFLSVFWMIAVVNLSVIQESVLILSALFYLLYFLIPIVNKKFKYIVYLLLPAIVISTFWTISTFPAVWFILFILAVEVAPDFTIKSTVIYLVYLTTIVLLPTVLLAEELQTVSQLVSIIFLSIVVLYLRSSSIKLVELQKERDQIFSDHRYLQRQVLRGEQLARQEERSVVARDIHDSVGHRLTALVMQLEVARYQAKNEEEKHRLTDFKNLAKQSLQETRAAVSALNSDETAGLQAIIQLVRKLESESHIKIRFLLESGVLSEPLTNEQSVVVYRAIQESLTNMMRHSQSKEADITFTLLANRYFQFTVSHQLKEEVEWTEGFGLTNMRKRLEEIDGKLTISQYQNRFSVTGQFPVDKDNRSEGDT